MPEEMSTKEIIKNYEKLAEENKKDVSGVSGEAYKKVLRKTAKIFAATLPPVLLTACAACEKPPVIEEQQQEEEKGQEIVLSETKEETKETTQETTQETAAPTTEAIPQTVEYKGSVFTLPEGSEASSQTGEILALVGNPYGVEAGTKIGQCIIDAFELNGKMENSIALRPEVIEYMQKKIMEEDKEFRYPLPFYPTNGIEIAEIEDKSLANSPQLKDLLWDKPKMLAISNLPLGTVVRSPLTTPNLIICNQSESNDWYGFDIGIKNNTYIKYNTQYNLSFNGQKVDAAGLSINIIGAEIIPLELNKKFPKEGIPILVMESKIGTPLVKIREKKFISNPSFEENDKVSVAISLGMSQIKFDENENKYVCTGYVETGLRYLLTMGDEAGNKEGIVVSMLSNE